MPDIKIPSFDGNDFFAYTALPETGSGPGVIVVADASVFPPQKKDVSDRLAAQGFVAVCPDVFGDGVLDKEARVRDLLSILGFVRKMDACTGKVGSVGFGRGGHMAYLLAARSDVDASVVFSPEGLEDSLSETYDIITPLLMHIGSEESLMKGVPRARFLRNVARNEKIALHVYEGMAPLFTLSTSAAYNHDVANLAESRTSAFLADRLKS